MKGTTMSKIDPRMMSKKGREAYLEDLLSTLDAHRQQWIGLDQEEIEEMARHVAICFALRENAETTNLD
jgi:hypothetical protein